MLCELDSVPEVLYGLTTGYCLHQLHARRLTLSPIIPHIYGHTSANPTASTMFHITQSAALTSHYTLVASSLQPGKYAKLQGSPKGLQGRAFNERPQHHHSQIAVLGKYYWKLTL